MSRIVHLVQEPKQQVVARCKSCNGPIYPNELVYQLADGNIIHRDGNCLWEYATKAVAPRKLSVEDALRNA